MKENAPEGTAKRLGRRVLLGGASLIAATVACAGREMAADERPDAGAAPDDQRRLFYRETDHIRWFYQRARM
jgi:hypothetical protein